MAEQDKQAEYLNAIGTAFDPMAQWLATGIVMDTTPAVAHDFAENARDTRKGSGYTATFTQEQTRPAPVTVATATTRQDMRRRNHNRLRR